ncbi:hypothetical protein QYF36_025432 [Acer negundo]|nr:hypothetical protein QYF36_025432 [Acer negundo]
MDLSFLLSSETSHLNALMGEVPDCLDKKKEKGKIVLCDHNNLYEPYTEAYEAGATGLITMNPEVNDLSSFAVDLLPASTLWYIQDYDAVMSYFNSTK